MRYSPGLRLHLNRRRSHAFLAATSKDECSRQVHCDRTYVTLETFELLNPIVTEIYLLQILQLFEVFNFCYAIRLNGQQTETLKFPQVLEVVILWPRTTTLIWLTSNREILFLPSHNSSRFTSASSPSIFCRFHCVRIDNRIPSLTRILLPPSSILVKVAPRLSSPVIVDIRSWTKYTVFSFCRYFRPSGMARNKLKDKSSVLPLYKYVNSMMESKELT